MGIETRIYQHASPETRVRVVNEEARTIRGYGIVFNSDSAVLYERGKRFVEVIRPEAVQGVDLTGIKCMHNHSASRLLGRAESGTMRTGIDETGTWYENDVPNSPTGQDVFESVRRGDTDGSSFQFTVAPGGETWSVKNGMAYREITKFDQIFEMGPVSDPAYPATADAGLSARSMEMLEQAATEIRSDESWVMSWLVDGMANMISYANWLMDHCERAAENSEGYATYDPDNKALYDQLKSNADAAKQAIKALIDTEGQILLSANARRDKDGEGKERRTERPAPEDNDTARAMREDEEIEAMQMAIL